MTKRYNSASDPAGLTGNIISVPVPARKRPYYARNIGTD
jgi:hypothetical protein